MFDKIILIGSGKIFVKCALEVANKFNKDIDIIMYEDTPFFPSKKIKSMVEGGGITIISNLDKNSLKLYLDTQQEKTLIISANNNYLFKADTISKKNLYIINFHNSLLPKHRGRNAQMWAIYEGDKYAGATWHIVNENIDDGDIISQKSIKIANDETSITLTKKLIELGEEMFKDFLPVLLSGKIKTKKQEKGSFDIHKGVEMPQNGMLDLSKNPDEISRFLRAMDFGKTAIVSKPKLKIYGQTQNIIDYTLTKHEAKIVLENGYVKIKIN